MFSGKKKLIEGSCKALWENILELMDFAERLALH